MVPTLELASHCARVSELIISMAIAAVEKSPFLVPDHSIDVLSSRRCHEEAVIFSHYDVVST